MATSSVVASLPFDIAPEASVRSSPGFSLYAAVRCGADNHKALEQLRRYIPRPALANGRVQTNAAGRVVLRLKTPSYSAWLRWFHGPGCT